MKLVGTVLVFCVLAGFTAVAAIHFLVPDTRSGTYTVSLRGTPDQVWAVYTDPGSLPNWRAEVKEIEDLRGEPGRRSWTEISTHNLRIKFRETQFMVPTRYELKTSSEGYFSGIYVAQFEQMEPGLVRGTFTESITTEGLRAKILALIFVRPRHLIEAFAQDAQVEIDRRSSQNG